MINTDMAQLKEAGPFYGLSEKQHVVFAQLMFNTSKYRSCFCEEDVTACLGNYGMLQGLKNL